MCHESPCGDASPTQFSIGKARRFSRALGPLALLLLAGGLLGCSARRTEVRRCAPPTPESRGTTNDAAGKVAEPADIEDFDRLGRNIMPADEDPPKEGLRRFEILAVSGGGKYGAYPAGVVCGWTCRGDRPKFDVATGVSTGSFVAVFGFLGPKYDPALKRLYTETTTEDVLEKYPFRRLPFTKSFASSEPLRELIASFTTDEVVADLCAAFHEGRHCYIGTTNLDTRRLCIWDVTAIAAGPRPDKKKLLVDIFLATASVPGEFPPVKMEIVVNGQKYTELHVDGGVTSEIFARLALIDVSKEQLRKNKRPLAGSRIHSLIAGRLFSQPDCVEQKLVGILGTSISSLVYAMTQNDLLRISYLCLLTGAKYRFTAVPDAFQDDGDALDFDPKVMGQLFNTGYEVGRTGEGWRTRIPGTPADEQSVPRSGIDFTIPNLPPPGATGGPVLPKPKDPTTSGSKG
jgi:hypothetical protein